MSKFKILLFLILPILVFVSNDVHAQLRNKSTIEAKSIAATKETPIYKVINETEKEILYDEESGDIIL